MKLPHISYRLIAPLVFAAALYNAEAGVVIDFNEANDLLQFQQVSSTFWAATPGAGLDGSNGLTGPNSGTPGWMVYQQGFSAQAASFSGGIFFKLAPPTSTSSGYSIFFGVGASNQYAPNPGGVSDETKNHYARVLQYTSSPETRRFRLSTHVSTGGAVSTEASDYRQLDFESWYYLGIESSFNSTEETYSLTVTLYEASDAGTTGEVLLTISYDDFALPALSGASEHYAFFGIDGRSELRGIAALDNFTYAPIPEGSAVAYIGAGIAAFFGFRRWQR